MKNDLRHLLLGYALALYILMLLDLLCTPQYV